MTRDNTLLTVLYVSGLDLLTLSAVLLLVIIVDSYTLGLITTPLTVALQFLAMLGGLGLLAMDSLGLAIIHAREGAYRLAAMHGLYIGAVSFGFILLFAPMLVVAVVAGLLMVAFMLFVALRGREWWTGPAHLVHIGGAGVSVIGLGLASTIVIVVGNILWAVGWLVTLARYMRAHGIPPFRT